MKGFQAGILIFFGVLVLVGVLIFSGAIKLPEKTKNTDGTQALVGSIRIWGTFPSKYISGVMTIINQENKDLVIMYQEKDPRTYKQDLLNAFAFGGLPDLFILPQDLIRAYEDKVLPIPFASFPERTFSDTYLRVSDVFKTPEGFLGFPIFVDPLVMYYNQDLMETAGYTAPPEHWSDFFDYIPKLTRKDDALQILQSGVAMGEYVNVNNAKEILLSLILQLNNNVIYKGDKDKYLTTLNEPSNVSATPAVQSLKFYNEFSNPVNAAYSWNKSRKDSQDDFISGDLAIYFGLASEYRNIKAKNPNLNFDVAVLPQVEELNNTIVYADVYALVIPKNSPKSQLALSVATLLSNGPHTLPLVSAAGYVPVRRDLVSGQRASKFLDVFYNSAISSRSWIDPDGEETDRIFGKMVEDVLSGLSTPEAAVEDAHKEIRVILSK